MENLRFLLLELYQIFIFLVCFLRFSILCKSKLIFLYCKIIINYIIAVLNLVMKLHAKFMHTQKYCCIHQLVFLQEHIHTYIYLCTPHYYSESVHPLTIADGFACLGGSRIRNNPNGKLAHRTNQPLSLQQIFPSLCVYIFVHSYADIYECECIFSV
jgi:hypothetical protein